MFLAVLLILPVSLFAEKYGTSKTEIREGDPRVTFISYNLQTEIAQGEMVSTSIFFKAIKPIEKSEKIFFHMVKSGSQETSLNADFSPRYPTNIWDVNQVVEAGPIELAIPFNLEPGDYDIRAGLMEIDRTESEVIYIREPYTNQEIKDFTIGKLAVTKTVVENKDVPSELDLVSFNTDQDMIFWDAVGAVIKLFKYSDEGEESTNAAEVTILPGPGFPGIMLKNFFKIKPSSNNWALYDTLKINLSIPATEPGGGLRLKISDKSGRGYESRITLEPGKIKNIDLSMVDLSGQIDVSNIEQVKLFLSSPTKAFTFYISKLQLISRGMPTGQPAVTFVRLDVPDKVKRGQVFRVRPIFNINQPIFQKHKLFVHIYRVNDHAGWIGTDVDLYPPIRNWELDKEIGIQSGPLEISEEAPAGTYIVRTGLYLIAKTGGRGYVKMDDWNAYGGETVINIMQPSGPIDYIKQPYTNIDIVDWEVGTILVE
jgi:hypothetical protein